MLGASLAIEHDRMPVTSLSDVLKTQYKLQVSKGSSVEAYFLNAEENTVHKQIVETNKLVAKVGLKDVDIFRSVANGTSLDDQILFFGVYQAITYLPEWTCKVASVKMDYRTVSNGLIFQKNWKFTEIFNYHLLKLKNEGILDQITKKYYV